VSSSVSPSRASLAFLFLLDRREPVLSNHCPPAWPAARLPRPTALAGVTDCWSKKKGVAIEDLSLGCWPRAGVNDVINIPLSLKMNDVHVYARNVNVVQE